MARNKKFKYTEEELQACNKVVSSTDNFKGSFTYKTLHILKHSGDMSLHFYDNIYAPLFNCKVSDIVRIEGKTIYVGLV